jgi:hypothetical protein
MLVQFIQVFLWCVERHLETGLPAASDTQHWRGVLQALQLSEQQVNYFLVCFCY